MPLVTVRTPPYAAGLADPFTSSEVIMPLHRAALRTGAMLLATLLVAPLLCAQEVLDPSITRTDHAIEIDQVWASTGTEYANTDSLAACRLPDGTVRLFATAKGGDRIDVFDAASGAFLARYGSTGDGPKQLRYPNGIVATSFGARATPISKQQPRPMVIVIERDNHRLQGFWSDTLTPAGTCAADKLKRPYGGAISTYGDGVHLYVTETDVPPDQTVRIFRIAVEDNKLRCKHVRDFGDRSGPGLIKEAESIAIDDRGRRVFLCDEVAKNVKIYDLAGNFTGRTLADGLIQGDPEGIVVIPDLAGGVLIVTDQQDEISIWHVYDLRTLTHQGKFTGATTIANTDGICILAEAFDNFPAGGLFAVNDDADVRAYGLDQIARKVLRKRVD
jgi:3-phytase